MLMKYHLLGKTGISVSELCYGALPIGPLQADFPMEKAADIIRYSLEQGVNFIDTAERYETYPHISKALQGFAQPVVIASKSFAAAYENMQQAIEQARVSLDRDVIDIFHLHAARPGDNVFVARQGALACLCDAKAAGIIRAVGISTHSATTVRLAADTPEIDVIHPLINLLGLGIIDGTLADMQAAIRYAAAKGKGIYFMKVMAGGHLADRFTEAFDFARAVVKDAIFAVGMLSRAEVDANVAYLEGRDIADSIKAQVGKTGKKLHVMDNCKACGICTQHCPNEAIKVMEGRAWSDPERCLLCGYCVPYCPQFSLRLISPV